VAAQGRVILVDNSLLEGSFSDRARVKRILGDLWFIPVYFTADPPQTCAESFFAAYSFFVQSFLGLRKIQVNNAGESLNVHPLDNDTDYSEAQWLKTWQHLWQPRSEIGFTAEHTEKSCAAYVCPDVHTSGILDNDFVDGTGTINIETDCGDPATLQCEFTQDAICRYNTTFPTAWHVHFDIKKTISMRENDQLVLDMDFIYGDAMQLTDPVIQIVGGIKTLLQF